MATYEGPQGRIVVAPKGRRTGVGEELLEWASDRPGASLGLALGLGLAAALLVKDDREAGRRGFMFRMGRFAAAGMVGQATSFLIQYGRRLVFG